MNKKKIIKVIYIQNYFHKYYIFTDEQIYLFRKDF